MLQSVILRSAKKGLAAFALSTMVLAGFGNMAVAETYKMKIGFLTINDPIHAVAKRFAEEIGKRSDGRIEPEVYPAGQLGSAGRQIEGMQFGTQEVFVTPPKIGHGWCFRRLYASALRHPDGNGRRSTDQHGGYGRHEVLRHNKTCLQRQNGHGIWGGYRKFSLAR